MLAPWERSREIACIKEVPSSLDLRRNVSLPPKPFSGAGSWEESSQELGEDTRSIFQCSLASSHRQPHPHPTPCIGKEVLATTQAIMSAESLQPRCLKGTPSRVWCKDKVEGLALSPSHIGMPKVHDEDHSRPIFWGA